MLTSRVYYIKTPHPAFPHMVQLRKGGELQNDFRSSHVASKRGYGDRV